MKLSEAILLGDSLKARSPLQWLSEDGSCGCAFGGALIAAGIHKQFIAEADANDCADPIEMRCTMNLWPWLTHDVLSKIGGLYMARKPIEVIADYVRSVEPSDPEPTTPVDEMEALYQREREAA